ncbi:hypothetical protein AURDEDRAFT_167701 [Auricularia subglabra TFB-10046 SS5]|nr:hypothetical protein AURDEDRAFT_167701 [Auricularia subglabra TFB-10046 SS5]
MATPSNSRASVCGPTLRDALSTKESLGKTFWVWASPDEAIFAAAAEHSSAAMSNAMLRRQEQITSANSSGEYRKLGRKRVCILIDLDAGRSTHISVVATTTLAHGAFSLEKADKYIQALAVAVGDTPPWPTADSPVVAMAPKWETTPCYALARVIRLPIARVEGMHISESRVVNLAALVTLAHERAEAMRELPAEHVEDLKISYDHGARKRKSRRSKSNAHSKASGNIQSGRVSFSTNLLSIPEGDGDQAAPDAGKHGNAAANAGEKIKKDVDEPPKPKKDRSNGKTTHCVCM